MTRGGRLAVVALAACAAASAEQWEIGGGVGYGLYRKGTVFSPAGTAQAGIRSRFAATFVAGDDMYRYWGSEVRYTYHDGDPFIQGGGQKVNIQGQSHAFHYDVLVYVRPREVRVRPYFAGGPGAKLYVVSGPAPVRQPFAGIATLTTTDQAKFLVSVGGGVKVQLARHLLARFDFRDYITTFPRKLILPAPSGTARGLFQQFTPLVGLSATF